MIKDDGKRRADPAPDDPAKKPDALERLARAIDPPGREVSDAELADPGANIPDSDGKGSKNDRGKPAP